MLLIRVCIVTALVLFAVPPQAEERDVGHVRTIMALWGLMTETPNGDKMGDNLVATCTILEEPQPCAEAVRPLMEELFKARRTMLAAVQASRDNVKGREEDLWEEAATQFDAFKRSYHTWFLSYFVASPEL